MNWLSTKKASCWRSSDRSATKPVATSDAGAGTPPDQPLRSQQTAKKSRAGRDLPAAIAVGAAIGGLLIATLVFAPRFWVLIVAIAIFIASHEVVRRLREGGYIIPVIPLLAGGQAHRLADLAVPCRRRAGRLRCHGRGLHDLAVVHAGREPAG